jgi:hypothetical protein
MMKIIYKTILTVLTSQICIVFPQTAIACDPSEGGCQVIIVGNLGGWAGGSGGLGSNPGTRPISNEPMAGSEEPQDLAAEENRCAFQTTLGPGRKTVTSTSSQSDRLAAATSAFIAMRNSMSPYTFNARYGGVGFGGYFQVVYADGAKEAWNVLRPTSSVNPLDGPAGAISPPNPDQSCSGIV